MGAAGRMKVLVSQPIHEAGMRILGERFEVCVSPDISAATLASQIQDCHGLLVRSARIPASVIEAAPRLKVIAVHGVGVDRIDVAAATRHGILVANTPEANALSVAEHVLALICALAKRLVEYDAATRRGEFEIRNSYRAVDLNGKVLGVIGMGRIGSLVSRKAKAAFDMEPLAFDPFVSSEIIEGAGVRPVASLSELLGIADVVTLHVPLTSETQGMMGAPQLTAMKPTALLINTSRGAVVDERALFESLREGRLAGAGLDVFDREPPDPKNPLFRLPNVVVTPHSASLSAECVVRMATQSARAVVDALEGRRPAAVVNPQVFVEPTLPCRANAGETTGGGRAIL